MFLVKIAPYAALLFTLAANALTSWHQDRKINETIKAEVEKQAGKSK